MPQNFVTFISTHQWIIVLAAIWTIPWKGVALWKAAQNKSPVWFVILLIVNTVGILEIIYIFVFSKPKLPPHEPVVEETKIPEKIVVDIKKETTQSLDDKALSS